MTLAKVVRATLDIGARLLRIERGAPRETIGRASVEAYERRRLTRSASPRRRHLDAVVAISEGRRI